MSEPQYPGGLASPRPTPDTESSAIRDPKSRQHKGDTKADCTLTAGHFKQERDSPPVPHKLAQEQSREEDEGKVKLEVKSTVAIPLPKSDDDEDDFGLDQVEDTGGCDQLEIANGPERASSKGGSESDTDSEHASSDSGSECDSSSSDESVRAADKRRRRGKSSKSKKPADEKRERQRPAKNAREYVARLHQAEDDAAERKRKRGLEDQHAGASKKKATKNMATCTLKLLANEQEDDNTSATAPLMKAIKATTHAEQLSLMKQNIPAGSDTRRTATQQKDLEEAISFFGYKQVEAVDGDWRLKKMKTALKPHQITAVAWMVKRELGRAAPYGGLLADVMGLGKTVMSLACMTGNPPLRGDGNEFTRVTLVVVPNKSIALQWKDEVQRHCKSPIGDWVSVYNPKEDKPLGLFKMMKVL